MALRGNLKDFSLPDVFQLVQLSGKTGVLRIVGTDAEGSIWFRDGDVFFAQSNWRREQLGERLVSAQRITPAALARALEAREAEGEGGRRLGQILVGEGYITQQVLETFVQEQIQDTIFDLMRWDEGEFDFEVLPEVVHEDIGLAVSVENIVMEGSRRLEEWQRIKKKVPSTDMVFKMATAPGEGTFEISLKPIEWALLLLIDGTRSVRELAVETHSTDFEVARVVYGLFSAGLLEVAADDEVERLRADRARREDKRAILEAERAARDAEQQEEALELEARLAADAEARREETAQDAATEAPVAEETPVAPAEPVAKSERVVEEPEFLASGAEAPSSDDMAVFEQMMASVLSPQVVTAPIAEPDAEPEVEPTPEAVPEPEPEPEPEPVLEFEAPAVSIPEADIEALQELMAEPQPETEFFMVPEYEAAPVAETGLETPEGADVAPEGELTIAEIEAALAAEAGISPETGAPEVELAEPSAEDAFGFGAISEADLEAIPAPPVAETEVSPAGETLAPSGDFEADLRSLGLGEYPEELLQPEPPAEARPPMSELEGAFDSGFESGVAAEAPEAVFESAREVSADSEFFPQAGAAPADQDLDSLLASLEVDSSAGGLIASETDYGPEAESEGVISTDAFLAEFDDVGLSAGLGDELTALTGGASGRSRPVATVAKLPEAGETHMLHRDQMVDRTLLEKIIEGVENL